MEPFCWKGRPQIHVAMTALSALPRAHQPPDAGPRRCLYCLASSDCAADPLAAVVALDCERRKDFPALEHF